MEPEEIMSLSKFRLNNRLRMTAIALVASLTLGSFAAFSQDSARLAADAPDEYVVQVGDTLWDIAATFLRDPWYWPEIWYVNPQIENPHLIYPGDVLGLVYVDGAPRITNVRGSSYRLSPEARATPLTEAITSISYDSVAAFLSRGVVIERDEVDALPYLVATKGDHLIAAAGNLVYVRGTGAQPGESFNVVTIGDELRDPDNNDLIGYQGIEIGERPVGRRRFPIPARRHFTIWRGILIPRVFIIVTIETQELPVTAIGGIRVMVVVLVMDCMLAKLFSA